MIIKGNSANSFNDRRNHAAGAARNSNTDENLADRIAKFNDNNALSTGRVYRIPLRYLVDVGLVNSPTAFNVKFTFNLEQNRIKLFETNGAVEILQMEILAQYRLHNLMLTFTFTTCHT